MKNEITLLLAIALAGLAIGCQPAQPGDAHPTNGTADAPVPPNGPTAGDYARAAVTNTVDATTQAWTEVKASFRAAMADGYDQKVAFVAQTKADIKVLDQKIQDLSDRAAKATDADQASIQSKLQDLRAKRAVLDQKLTDVKNATAMDWNDTKAAFQNAYDDVKKSCQDVWHSLTAS